jgi:small subunit ribosomal protein S3
MELDAQLMADNIATSIEALGPLKFKVIAYKALQKIMEAGALGAEIRLGGKLPSDRAKSWRFASGYLKKTGDSAKVVDKALTTAETRTGTIGVKVSILPPDVILNDQITVNDAMRDKIEVSRANLVVQEAEAEKEKLIKKTKKKTK